MKLSDAIRAGSKLAPQTTRGNYAVFNYGEVDGTCALGAAIHSEFGIKVLGEIARTRTLTNEVTTRWAKREKYKCPHRNCGIHFKHLVAIIYHLNDTHMWTRESIAEWIDEFVFDESCKASNLSVTEPITV